MTTRNSVVALLASVFVAACIGGCSSPATPDPSSSDPNAANPAAGTTPATLPGTADASLSAPAAPAPTIADMTAAVTAKSGGIFSDFGCTVVVTNPSSVARTGKVTVTFVHGSTPETGSPPQTQSVSVAANGTQSLTFKDTAYHILSEDATVTVTSDPVPSAAPAAGAGVAASSTTPGVFPSPPPGGYGNTN